MPRILTNNHKTVYQMMKDLKSWVYIDSLQLSAKEIEKTFIHMTLDVQNKKKDEYIERNLHIEPSMVGFFYYFIYVYKRIPTQMEYVKFYYLANQKWIEDKISPGNKHEAFFGRLSRFYPSMLRDIHFYHLLKDSGTYESVLFQLKYDLEAKVDVFVRRNGYTYGVQLRTQTKRSNEFYEKKKNRNPLPVDAILVDLPINLSEAKSLRTKKDDIKLYGKEQLDELLRIIEIGKEGKQIIGFK